MNGKKILILFCVLIFLIVPQLAVAEQEQTEQTIVYRVSDYEIVKIAKTLWGECRGSNIPTSEKAAVVWCILNRCDAWDMTVNEVITKNQFHGYSRGNPIDDELLAIAKDVVLRWQLEKVGLSADVGRTLPKDYLYFAGHGGRNHFRTAYKGGQYWDWTLESPYETEQETSEERK